MNLTIYGNFEVAAQEEICLEYFQSEDSTVTHHVE